jgi:hypothetical protein
MRSGSTPEVLLTLIGVRFLVVANPESTARLDWLFLRTQPATAHPRERGVAQLVSIRRCAIVVCLSKVVSRLGASGL